MNLYIRYFDIETLVTNVDDAIDFLSSINEIDMDDRIANDVKDYFESDLRYPKRYKVRPRIYFIMIKTEAKNMQEFKEKKASANHNGENPDSATPNISIREQREKEQNELMNRLTCIREGWYEGVINFKRVITNPSTGKNEYKDATFSAQCKASSAKDCYNRLIEYLSHRVDPRSQFPSIKGHNYNYRFLGKAK